MELEPSLNAETRSVVKSKKDQVKILDFEHLGKCKQVSKELLYYPPLEQ